MQNIGKHRIFSRLSHHLRGRASAFWVVSRTFALPLLQLSEVYNRDVLGAGFCNADIMCDPERVTSLQPR